MVNDLETIETLHPSQNNLSPLPCIFEQLSRCDFLAWGKQNSIFNLLDNGLMMIRHPYYIHCQDLFVTIYLIVIFLFFQYLRLKLGSPVMLTRNITHNKRLINGNNHFYSVNQHFSSPI